MIEFKPKDIISLCVLTDAKVPLHKTSIKTTEFKTKGIISSCVLNDAIVSPTQFQ
jgi:hypothetical protein